MLVVFPTVRGTGKMKTATHTVLFFALAAVVLSQAVDQCKSDANCTSLQYCKKVSEECVIKLKTGDTCKTDNMCQSGFCLPEGKCSKDGRGLSVGIIAGIACGGVAALAFVVLCIFCICKRRRNKKMDPEQ